MRHWTCPLTCCPWGLCKICATAATVSVLVIWEAQSGRPWTILAGVAGVAGVPRFTERRQHEVTLLHSGEKVFRPHWQSIWVYVSYYTHVCSYWPGVVLLTWAALLGMTGVTLGGGIPAAMSNRGWMMSLLKTAFFCHRFRTRTILLCKHQERWEKQLWHSNNMHRHCFGTKWLWDTWKQENTGPKTKESWYVCLTTFVRYYTLLYLDSGGLLMDSLFLILPVLYLINQEVYSQLPLNHSTSYRKATERNWNSIKNCLTLSSEGQR